MECKQVCQHSLDALSRAEIQTGPCSVLVPLLVEVSVVLEPSGAVPVLEDLTLNVKVASGRLPGQPPSLILEEGVDAGPELADCAGFQAVESLELLFQILLPC